MASPQFGPPIATESVSGELMAAVVVVNGWYRTGSTLCFYAVQRILAARGLPFRVAGQDFADADTMIAEHLAQATGEWLVLKSHNWLPSADNQDRVITLHSRRHPADIMRSAMKLRRRQFAASGRSEADADAQSVRDGVPGLVWLLLFYRYMLPRLPMHVIEYEKFYDQPRRLVVHLAGLLNLALTEAEIENVMADIDVRRIKDWTDRLDGPMDPQSHFRQYAISETLGRPDGSLEDLPDVYRTLIERAGLAEMKAP